MMVVASAVWARYWLTVMPPRSVSAGKKVFSVTGVATLPARIRLRCRLIDQLVDRFEEVLLLEKIRDAVERTLR